MIVEIADSFDKIFGDFSTGDGDGISTLGLILGDVDIGFESTELAGEGRLKVKCGSGDGTCPLGNEDLPAFAGDAPRWLLDTPCPACVSTG